ncbi:hypothetical protein ASE16_00540 [Leifsonia sp. Root227]|uniref:DUF1697 domain-containing protein n=1 Tax=Leifsonia sp. Root227 TaxID=1736496 RepID=UPI0006FC161F|nr:DUF1697 domain-containing protein [Leifsonia sp. Root227]KRC51621.1 hypothetical protein ASE16_00540 [Leifsonia sp. Root227]
MAGYVALLRGINVGGANLIGMDALAEDFRAAGYESVRTHSQSGNVLFTAEPQTAPDLEAALESMLRHRLDAPLTVIARSRDELAATVAAAPADHGSDEFRSEVFFLKHPLAADEVMAQLPELRDGVDRMAPGPGALYFSRTKALATKTRIQRLMAMPVFKRMTVRTWRTTTRLLELLDA